MGGISGALLVAQGLTVVVGLVSARALGPAEKGQVTAVISWAQVLTFVFLLGLPSALSVRVAESRQKALGTAMGSTTLYVTVMGTVVAVAAMIVLPPMLSSLGDGTDLLIRWAIVGGVIGIGTDLLGRIRLALQHNRRYFVYRLALPGMTAAIVLPLWLSGHLTAGWMVAAYVVGTLLAAAVVAAGLPWRTTRISRSALSEDLRFGLKTWYASTLGVVNLRLDLLLMSVFVSATQVGLYGLANNLMIPLTVVPGAAALILLPKVASQESPDGSSLIAHQVRRIKREAMRNLLFASAVGIVLAVVTPIAISSLLGESYRGSVLLVHILIPGYIARAYLGVIVAGAIGMRRAWLGTVAEGSAIVLTATLLPILLPRFGARGAAITSTIAYVAAALIGTLALRRFHQKSGRGSQSGTENESGEGSG
jgi:O-antigen/teichoic acid export membrane protein